MRFDLSIITENYRKIISFTFVALIALTLAAITTNVTSIAMEKDFELKPDIGSRKDTQRNLFRISRSISYYDPIAQRNIFDSENRQPEEKPAAIVSRPEKEEPSYSGPPVKSSMNATLVGTMVFSDPGDSFAKVAKGSGNSDAESYYIGDDLLGEAQVTKIERNRVFFKRNGRIEYLEIEAPTGRVMPSYSSSRGSVPYRKPQRKTPARPSFSDDDVRKVGDNKFILNRKMVDKLLSNYNSVLTQARAVPNFQNGKANGFKIFSIKRNSIYSAIGIKNGDVLTRVNGSEINNLEKVLSLFNQLRNESNITIDLVRGGAKKSFEYEIR